MNLIDVQMLDNWLLVRIKCVEEVLTFLRREIKTNRGEFRPRKEVYEKCMNFIKGAIIAEVKAHDSYEVCINQEKENLY